MKIRRYEEQPVDRRLMTKPRCGRRDVLKQGTRALDDGRTVGAEASRDRPVRHHRCLKAVGAEPFPNVSEEFGGPIPIGRMHRSCVPGTRESDVKGTALGLLLHEGLTSPRKKHSRCVIVAPLKGRHRRLPKVVGWGGDSCAFGGFSGKPEERLSSCGLSPQQMRVRGNQRGLADEPKVKRIECFGVCEPGILNRTKSGNRR